MLFGARRMRGVGLASARDSTSKLGRHFRADAADIFVLRRCPRRLRRALRRIRGHSNCRRAEITNVNDASERVALADRQRRER